MSGTSARTEPSAQPRLGPVGWLRWGWRQLTSMRTALFLLLLLAVAALPGSTFPQRSINSARTAAWIDAHPTAGPILDRLGFFEVYASPWFAAVYLLLFVSLVGCVLPRTGQHWKAMRSAPPKAPRRLDRLDAHDRGESSPASAEDALAAAARSCVARRYRVHAHDDDVPERGEGLPQGDRQPRLPPRPHRRHHRGRHRASVGVEGRRHRPCRARPSPTPCPATTPSAPGRGSTPRASRRSPSPSTRSRRPSSATSPARASSGCRGTSRHTRRSPPSRAPRLGPETIKVNDPLETGGPTVFLLGNGYAPKITVRDADGTVVYSDATPFLAPGQQLQVGRRGQGAGRRRRSSSGSPGCSSRPASSPTTDRPRSSPTPSTRRSRSPSMRAPSSPTRGRSRSTPSTPRR